MRFSIRTILWITAMSALWMMATSLPERGRIAVLGMVIIGWFISFTCIVLLGLSSPQKGMQLDIESRRSFSFLLQGLTATSVWIVAFFLLCGMLGV